ncbi:MAG: oxidoreductase [Candidatus Binatia bacterium]
MTTVSKAVLITGCSTGIGRVTAQRLAKSGHTVYATARKLESIAALAADGCTPLALDVCDEDSMRAAVATIERAHGAVGVLINNAGYGSEGPVEEIPMSEVRRQFETNVFGLLRLTQLVLPAMRHQGWGKVVNLSSMGGRMTLPGGGMYHATKYAVEALSDALRFEVRGFGVDVIVVEPGAIRTEFGNTAIAKVDAIGGTADYAPFRESIKQNIRGVYEGPMAAFAVGPEKVAQVIEKAITTSRPRTRYVITAGAHVLLGLHRWLPDRAFDAVMRTQYTAPRPS